MDPHLIGIVPKQSYKTILEEMIRGKLLRDKNEGTTFFAKMLEREWKSIGCVNEYGELLIEKLKQAFKDGTVDINIMCNAIGKKALSENDEDH